MFITRLLFFILLNLSICNTLLHAETDHKDIHPHLENPSWFLDSFLNFKEDLAEASAENKRLLLYFHQEGCPYCDKFIRDNFYDQQISKKIQKYFNLIELDIWGDRLVTDFKGQEMTEKAFAQQYKVQYTPTLIFLDSQGKPINRLNGYYPPYKFTPIVDYIGQNLNKKMAFSAYYQQQKQPKASGKLHIQDHYLKPPYDLSKKMKKPLLVLFAQKVCQSCDELDQLFLKNEGLKQLLEDFNIILLDRFSNQLITTPNGQKISIKKWANQLNIQYLPSILFYKDEKEIFRMESWFEADHLITGFTYILTKAYLKEPEFQRYIRRLENEKRQYQ